MFGNVKSGWEDDIFCLSSKEFKKMPTKILSNQPFTTTFWIFFSFRHSCSVTYKLINILFVHCELHLWSQIHAFIIQPVVTEKRGIQIQFLLPVSLWRFDINFLGCDAHFNILEAFFWKLKFKLNQHVSFKHTSKKFLNFLFPAV